MRPKKHRLLIAAATAGAVVAALAVAPAAQAKPAKAAKVTSKNVIVLLKNQHSTIKSKRGNGRSSERAKVIANDQSGVITSARKMGATHIRQYNVVNAFAATIKSDKLAELSRNSDVAAVVPDLPISQLTPSSDAGKVRAADDTNSVPYSSYCSTDPSKPRIEPEALQTMHVAYDDPNKASAAKLEDGSGIKVGWIADGIDINNPDFIRADGSHVFTDYQDFSGDGLDAPSGAAEAFGDASSIAAQGRETYNVADYASAANPLPDGCYIHVRGVAPGASLVGLKVFGNSNSAPTSHFIAAIQYAVTTAGVDVLNESFGGDPYPDNMDDPISLVNNAAIAAGVTVVSSTGDAGTNGTIGSPATSSQVIGVAATTNYRIFAQTKLSGFSNPAAGIKSWANDNISSLSSGGYAQNGKMPDVAAPGDSGWALCTPDLDLYTECSTLDGAPSSLLDFGGTSQSSPLTAGTAALVIGAYEKTHHGVRPSPALVKSIIVGTAQDLGHPAYEQGTGEVDALAAVRAARSIPAPGSTTVPSTASGAQLITSTSRTGVDQLDLAGPSGSSVSGKYTVTNASAAKQTISLSTRALTKQLSKQDGNIVLDPTQTFPNVTGSARAYKFIDVKVPVGADRLDASLAFNAPNSVFLALIDPFGVFQAYNSPQGAGNFAHVDARYPAPGTWRAMVWATPTFTGNINYEFTTSKFSSYGKVSPSSVTLAAGASASVTATFPTATNAGDSSAAVVMKSALGTTADMPVSIRTLLPTKAKTNLFSGVITGGNGRGGGGTPAQTNTYYLDVPSGKPALSVSIRLNRMQYPNEVLYGFLVGPNGHTLSARSNIIVNSDGELDVGNTLFTFARAPHAGRWRFILELTNPAGGDVVNQPFLGAVRFNASTITAVKPLPTSKTTLTRGKTYTYGVTIKNTSSQQQLYFADPRLNKSASYPLASQVPDNDLQNLSLPNPEVTPQWLVPTSTSTFNVTASGSVPIGLDVFYNSGDPEVYGSPMGNSASVSISASPEVANGPWAADIGEPGPFSGPAPVGTASANASVTTAAFDTATDSSLGDYWFTSFIPATSAAANKANGGPVGVAALGKHSRYLNAARYQAAKTPVKSTVKAAAPACDPADPILEPGQSCTVTVTITPTAASGTTVTGQLHIQTLDLFNGTVTDLASLAYAYKVK